MKDLFDQFRAVRENKKITLEEASQELRISKCYLEAIENFDLHLLPDPVYTIGFVKNYAKFLRIDHTEIVNCFKNEQISQKKCVDAENQQKIEACGFPIFPLKFDKLNVLHAAVVVAILIVVSLLIIF